MGTMEFYYESERGSNSRIEGAKRKEKNGIVELTFYVKNQNDELVLTNVTEMIAKKRKK